VDWSRFPSSWYRNTSQPPSAGGDPAAAAAGGGAGEGSRQAVEELLNSVPVDMLLFVNASTDPCDDFYEFACGGWLEDVTIPLAKEAISLSWSQGSGYRV
jgi:hypothetical protein